MLSCAQCKHVVWTPMSPPLCSRILMRPGNQFTPCSVARTNPLLCGKDGRFYEELKYPVKDDDMKPMKVTDN